MLIDLLWLITHLKWKMGAGAAGFGNTNGHLKIEFNLTRCSHENTTVATSPNSLLYNPSL